MMKRFNFNAATKAMLGAGLLSLMLAGCGSDGKDGETGKPGPVGTPISKVNTLKSKINSASVDTNGFLTINFSLSDANGAAVFGLKNTDIGAVSFGRVGSEDEIEGLTNVEGQAREIWLSYFNKDKGDGFYTGSSYFQGKNCEDCLTDNQDGTYTLKLNKAIDTLGKYDYKADMVNGIYLASKQPMRPTLTWLTTASSTGSPLPIPLRPNPSRLSPMKPAKAVTDPVMPVNWPCTAANTSLWKAVLSVTPTTTAT